MNGNGIKLRKRLAKEVSPTMREELDFLLNEVDREEPEEGEAPYDIVYAFIDVEDRIRELQKECRQILIEIGYYRPMSQEEIDQTTVTSGTKWDFKLNGVAYTSDHAITHFFGQ